jgi:hypothetical protein
MRVRFLRHKKSVGWVADTNVRTETTPDSHELNTVIAMLKMDIQLHPATVQSRTQLG